MHCIAYVKFLCVYFLFNFKISIVMKALFFSRISVVLIFALIGLSAYAGLRSDDEPYKFDKKSIGQGWTRWTTDCYSFDFSYPEGTMGGMGLTYRKGIYPYILLEIMSIDKKFEECFKQIENTDDGVISNQTLILTLTNGEVFSTSNAIINTVYADEIAFYNLMMDETLSKVCVQANIFDFRKNKDRDPSKYSYLQKHYIINSLIKSLITYDIKKIEMFGISFNVSTRSASTFRAMLKEIDEEFGTKYIR